MVASNPILMVWMTHIFIFQNSHTLHFFNEAATLGKNISTLMLKEGTTPVTYHSHTVHHAANINNK